MKTKKIANVVFYKFYGEDTAKQQACVFYTDGTVENVSYDEGLDAAEVIAREERIRTKDDFANMINSNRVHVLSGKDMEKRFQEFIVNKEQEKEKTKVKLVENGQGSNSTNYRKNNYGTVVSPLKTEPKASGKENLEQPEILVKDRINDSSNKETETSSTDEEIAENERENEQDSLADEEFEIPDFLLKDRNNPKSSEEKSSDDRDIKVPDFMLNPENKRTDTNNSQTADEEDILTDSEEAPIEDEEEITPITPTRPLPLPQKNSQETIVPAKKQNIFKRALNKIKKSKLVRRLMLCATALAVSLGIYSCASRKTKEGQMYNSNIETASTDSNGIGIPGEFKMLLETTPNESQKLGMKNISKSLDKFNIKFANAHLEKDKDIKAALSWDEMVALDLAYNDYSKERIKAMFNGTELDETELSNAYKTGTLQLMGAYVIETRDTPVNSKGMINSEEGKKFVEKYNDMFLQCKEATGEERVAKVNAFYKELYKDFPISDEIREEGIAHADSRKTIKSYKLAVTPIVGATEMMFQNLDIDHTLSKKAIAYFNDLGLCNIADEAFERAANITLMSDTNPDLPLYEDFKNAKIAELQAQESYVIDDEHRDLSKLEEFQKWVNSNFEFGNGAFIGGSTGTSTTTSTRTETSTTYRTETKKEQTSDRKEAVDKTSEEEVKKAEDEVDKEIEKENDKAKEDAEKEAEENRKEMQEEADKEADKIKDEIKKDEEDLQDKIEDANDQIENNNDNNPENDKPVNEDDFGDHDVDFDDNHSNENGDLDDSVIDITTDPSDDKTEEALPDPDDTGKIFDDNFDNTSPENNESQTETSPIDYTQDNSASENESGQEIIEYEEPVTETRLRTNEEIVDEYIENMANASTYEEEAYVYTK